MTEHLLHDYIKDFSYSTYIEIHYYHEIGDGVKVEYYTDKDHYYKESITISTLELLTFIYKRI